MINADNRVTEVIIGLLCADANACYEYARPQSRAHLRALANGACMVDRIAHHLECLRPDELMVWEFPEEYDPLPGRALPDAIDAGAVGDNDRVWACLEGLAFEHLAATASAAAHLERSAMLTARKLGSYPRQNGLAIALRELGRIERTLFILDWLQNVELRRRVHAGLNKGEARNTRARAVFFNRLGEIRDRSFERRRYRASGLNLVTAAIVLRNTAYLERITTHLCDKGGPVDEELLQYLSPLGWDHIYLTGDYVWQQNRGIAPGQCRPLRATPNA